ncbi:protein of unknown function [Xenorhabdus doucetiae]|uniref:Uncharacterized protein n=1 Tax=Xenorhabdus doucetiae TaxID=351671 RepID=A0A068QSV6_9GAMM|nr:protein of unknown function [Xenorhabdus doucetiae]
MQLSSHSPQKDAQVLQVELEHH